jgi:demethylmenaquinone methyltransferase/2-methoxy-6-polyprenyl-1,4-benzoquinol methylase
MKILESSPRRYDTGIKILTLGKVNESYNRLVHYVNPGDTVLDIGCGTGAMAIKAAEKGGKVKGIDVNPDMLQIAQEKVHEMDVDVEFEEMGVAELDREPSQYYDIVLSGLCFSELTPDEIQYTLKEVYRILKPGGLVIIADEVVPESVIKKVGSSVVRGFLKVLTFVVSHSVSNPVRNLPGIVKKWFTIVDVNVSVMGTFMEVVAQKVQKEENTKNKKRKKREKRRIK